MDLSIFGCFFTTLCGGDKTSELTLFELMEGTIVTPEIKPGKAIVLVGPPCCGMSIVSELLRRMLGDGAVLTATAETETWGRFNEYMEKYVVCIDDDMPFFHDARHVNLIQCHPPAGDAAAHFGAFSDLLDQAAPHDLRLAVLSYAAYLNRPRGWKALRAYWRARWIGVYWHTLTSKHMAPGGKMARRDRAAYEAD